jgi:hypothetical protein
VDVVVDACGPSYTGDRGMKTFFVAQGQAGGKVRSYLKKKLKQKGLGMQIKS